MTAKVNYIIAAQDATKDAIRSIQANFRTLNSSVTTTAKGINLALGFLAGAGIKSLFRASLDATAEASGKNSEFAKTLDEMRAAARNLMVPTSGLPGVTSSLKELTAVLKDPATIAAADAIFSKVLQGGAAAARFFAESAKGWRYIATGKTGDAAKDLKRQIDENTLSAITRLPFESDKSFEQRSKTRLAYVADLKKQLSELKDAPPENKSLTPDWLDGFVEEMKIRYEQADKYNKDYEESAKELNKSVLEMQQEFVSFGDAGAKEIVKNFEDIQKSEEDSAEFFNKMFEESMDRRRKEVAESEKAFNAQTEYAKEAARNMQDALAQFLFDPFHDGLKGMLKGFVDTIRKIVAEVAASKIFGSKSSGGLGLGDFVTSFVGSFFGGFKAGGGSVSSNKGYVVGENGPEWFQPGGNGFVTPNYALAGGGVTNHFTIDARGAGPDVEVKIRNALAQAAPMIVDASRRAIKDDFSRRAIR